MKVPHETPYKVSWLNDDQSLIVNEQALVEFQIGGYKDRVLCDVRPMQCCHLLLGRPWQFDKHVVYDGRANTYQIEHNGNSFTLIPFQEEVKEQTKATKVIMMGKKEYVKMGKVKNDQLAAMKKVVNTRIEVL